jgi:hypothetical protein
MVYDASGLIENAQGSRVWQDFCSYTTPNNKKQSQTYRDV